MRVERSSPAARAAWFQCACVPEGTERSSPWPASAGAEDASYHAQNPARKGAFVGAGRSAGSCMQTTGHLANTTEASSVSASYRQRPRKKTPVPTPSTRGDASSAVIAPLQSCGAFNYRCSGALEAPYSLFWCIGSTLFAATRPVARAPTCLVNAAWAARTAHERRISSASA